jgi:S1/P1 Nuclease
LTAQQLPGRRAGQSRGLLWLGLLSLLYGGSGWPGSASGWDNFGHMTVAAVAWQQLTPAARAQAGKLLRLNPDYAMWVTDEAPDQQDVIAFLRASTWPDAIKHEVGYIDDGEYPGPDASQNLGYEDLREHRYWHYVDVPFSPDGTPLPGVPTPNAATRIVDFRRVLADRAAPDSLRSYDLVWLMHLVGDIHQPLHAVSRFTRALPEGDMGGNRIRLCTPPCREELHFFWDDAVGRGGPTEALALARELPTPAMNKSADTRVQDWVDESGQIARRIVYAPPIGPGAGPYALTPAYRERARMTARDQVALAGGRLAALLNTALAPDTAAGTRRATAAISPQGPQ